MLTIKETAKFRKDVRKAKRRGRNLKLLREVLIALSEQTPLAFRYHDHALTGNFAGFRECHIQSDWLLIYAIDGENIILTAFRTGTHADLLE